MEPSLNSACIILNIKSISYMEKYVYTNTLWEKGNKVEPNEKYFQYAYTNTLWEKCNKVERYEKYFQYLHT